MVDRDAPREEILVEVSETTRAAGTAAGALAAKEAGTSETTRAAGTAAGALAAKEAGTSETTRADKAAGTSETTRAAGTAAGARTRVVVNRAILVEEGIQARVEGETEDVETPEHSSSASFCVFRGEEC